MQNRVELRSRTWVNPNQGIWAILPVDESAIDQSANGSDAQTTLANNDRITKQLASTIGIRETTEPLIAQFGKDSTPDPEVTAQVLSQANCEYRRTWINFLY